MTRREAALYVESFNRAMLEQSKKLWALPVKVILRLEGDLSPGQSFGSDVIATQLLDMSPLPEMPEQAIECPLPSR